MYEISIEQYSYWYPYVRTLSYTDYALNWDSNTIKMTQDDAFADKI